MKRGKLIWVLVAVLCLSMIAFAGCGSSEEEQAAEDSPYPMTVEDNDYFTFEIVDRDDFWGEYTYKVTNKTDQDITLDGEKAIINGDTTVDAFIYADMAANTSTKDSFYLSEEDVGDYEDGESLTMTVKYNVYNSDYDTISSGSFDFKISK